MDGMRVIGAGAATFVLAPAVVHWAHGKVERGFASLGLRLGLPLGGSQVGAAVGLIGDVLRMPFEHQDTGWFGGFLLTGWGAVLGCT